MKKDEIFPESIKEEFQERGNKVIEMFGDKIFYDIQNEEIKKILLHVKEYWKDNFRPALSSLSIAS